METKDMNFLGIIAIIGAILMIVGVFLKWLSFLGFGDASGWDVFNSWRGDYGYGFVPLIALISGIVSLCLMIAPTFIKADHLKKVFVVLGVIAMILAIVVLGGMGSQLGVILAAAVMVLLQEMRGFAEYRMLIFGLMMIVMMIWRPNGLRPMQRPHMELRT